MPAREINEQRSVRSQKIFAKADSGKGKLPRLKRMRFAGVKRKHKNVRAGERRMDACLRDPS